MNWRVWDAIEATLVEQKIAPILAVVPDNRDKALRVSPPDPRFWEKVRLWRASNWTIGMHGWQHQFVTKDPGMLKVNQYSEFAGLPRAEQERKLRAGSAIFNREGIESDVWIAPAHSFDAITIELLLELGFRYISDGFHLLPHIDKVGMMWIPQQLWGFRWRPFGVWTICFHITTWTAADIAAFKENTKRYRTAISSFDEVVQRFGNRRGTVLDDPAAHIYRSMTKSASQLKRQANRVSSVIHGNGFTDREKGREKESSGKVSPSAS